MSVPVPISESLLPLVNKLETLAAMEPVVAEHIAPIINDLLDFAMTSGKSTDPKVWVRALQAAVIYVETNHFDEQWLSATPINKPR